MLIHSTYTNPLYTNAYVLIGVCNGNHFPIPQGSPAEIYIKGDQRDKLVVIVRPALTGDRIECSVQKVSYNSSTNLTQILISAQNYIDPDMNASENIFYLIYVLKDKISSIASNKTEVIEELNFGKNVT